MAVEELDFESGFLDHSTRASGSGYLKKWKEDGMIVVWFHPQAPILSVWAHTFMRLREEENDDTREVYKRIRNMRINCLEKESVLKRQNFRTRSGHREMPPQICPHCKLIEWVRERCDSGKLKLSEPIFELVGEDDTGGEEVRTIHAGGFCGIFNKKKKTRDELKELRLTGIKESEAFMFNAYARQQYVMTVLADSDLDAGWVIATESQTLGDKVKKEIRDQIKRCDGDLKEGHPKYNPYPFEWTYDENKLFSEKYGAVGLTRRKPSDAIRTLMDDEPPGYGEIAAPPKLGTLKQLMEQARVIDMPLDELFDPAFEEFGEEYEDSEAGDAPEPSRPAEVNTDDDPVAEFEGDPADAELPYLCGHCGAGMGDELICKKCGAETSESGELVARPCANPDCMEKKVPDDVGICPQCGATHDEDWRATLPPKGRTVRRQAAATRPAEPERPERPARRQVAPERAERPATREAEPVAQARVSRRQQAREALKG